MLLLICAGLLLVTGFVTVSTEAFTHLITRRSLWSTFKEFLLESWLFSLTAWGWAGTVWLGLRWLGIQAGFLWVFEVLAFALWWQCGVSPQAALILALPGYLAHFLFLELRLLRRGEAA